MLTAVAEAMSDLPDIQESAYMLANPTPPTIEAIPGEVEYDQTFGRGHDKWYATLRLTVGTPTDKGAQLLLRKYRDPAGAYSVKAAVEADRTFGGLCDNSRVTKVSPMRQFRRPEGEVVLGCDFELEYWGSGLEQG